MTTLPLKSSRNEQCAVIRFFCGQKGLKQMRFTRYNTRHTVRTWPPVSTGH